MRGVILAIYNVLLPVVVALGMPAWIVKMFRRGGFGTGLSERLGIFKESEDYEPSGVVYVHAVSVGEVFIALKLIRCWRQMFPEDRFVLAPTTATGHAVAKEHASDEVRVIYSPLDFRWITRRVLKRFLPKQIVLIEAEMWPNMLDIARQMQIPVGIANARLSARSERRFKKLRCLVAPLFSMVSKIAAQEVEDKSRWEAIGFSAQAVCVTGSIKFDQEGAQQPTQRKEFQEMLDAFGKGRPVVMAVSTHAGEEEMIGQVMREITGNALYVVVPRHAERRFEVKAGLEACGYEVILRSAFTSPVDQRNACLVVDSTGELRDWIAHSQVVVIGKSFLGYGGQNPAEAIAAGVPVIAGAHMENFQPLSSMLERAGGIHILEDSAALGATIESVLMGGEVAMIDAAQRVLESHLGANRRTVEWLRVARVQ